MFRRMTVLALLLFIVGGSSLAFAWWDRLNQEATDQQLFLGYGVRLVLEEQTTEEQGVLVPVGSFYAAVDGYTTEYTFTYTLNLEENLDDFDLLIRIIDLQIGGVDYNPAAGVHGPLSIVIQTAAGVFETVDYDTDITGPNTNLRLNEVLKGNGIITIEIVVSLLAHTEDALFVGDLVDAYQALAGQTISFAIEFEVPAFADQSNNPAGFTVYPAN